ncbi:MAG: hypothetical protein MK082_06115 [Phycisphaerales bacterium]|nr:hypothetical protein [Phycisphaerales bacterium]
MGLIDQLLTLYRVDSQVRGLRTRVDNAERYLKVQDRQLEQIRNEQAEAQLHIRQKEASASNLETEREGFTERIEKLRLELNTSTTSKQYTAVQTEMSGLKEKAGELDNEALELLEQVETERERLAEIDEKASERSTIRDRAATELEERRVDVGDRLSELEGERDVAASAIPDHALTIFNKVADDTEGETLCEVREVSRRHREYACGSCSMELPFDAVVRLTNSDDDLVQCSGCYRILYLAENLKGELAK